MRPRSLPSSLRLFVLALAESLTSSAQADEMSPEQHQAVQKGLEWLAKNQQKDGHGEAFRGQYPFAGTTRFEGIEELLHLLCDPRALRDGYLEALEENLVEVRRSCMRLGIDYQLVRTSDYLDVVLSKFLHHRMSARTTTMRNREQGCSLLYFLGDKTRPTFYNDTLFKKLNGPFLLLIGNKPYNPLDPGGLMPPEKQEEKAKDRLPNDDQPKAAFPRIEALSHRDAGGLPHQPVRSQHRPLLPGAAAMVVRSRTDERYLGLGIRRVAEQQTHQRLQAARPELGRKQMEQTRDLSLAEPDAFDRYVEPAENYQKMIRDALIKEYLSKVVWAVDAQRQGRGGENDPKRPDMEVLWAHPKMKGLASQLDEFRTTIEFSDPLASHLSFHLMANETIPGMPAAPPQPVAA